MTVSLGTLLWTPFTKSEPQESLHIHLMWLWLPDSLKVQYFARAQYAKGNRHQDSPAHASWWAKLQKVYTQGAPGVLAKARKVRRDTGHSQKTIVPLSQSGFQSWRGRVYGHKWLPQRDRKMTLWSKALALFLLTQSIQTYPSPCLRFT